MVSRADSAQSVGVLPTSQNSYGGTSTSTGCIYLCSLTPLITLPLNDSHSTMSCVLSEELAPTPLEAVQVMVAKALSLVTLVALRVLVTLSVVMF